MTEAEQQLARLLKQRPAGVAGIFSGQGALQSGSNVVIHNNAGVAVTATGNGGFDRKTLEITIDQMVAGSLANGRETSGVLRSLFGIVPDLLGR